MWGLNPPTCCSQTILEFRPIKYRWQYWSFILISLLLCKSLRTDDIHMKGQLSESQSEQARINLVSKTIHLFFSTKSITKKCDKNASSTLQDLLYTNWWSVILEIMSGQKYSKLEGLNVRVQLTHVKVELLNHIRSDYISLYLQNQLQRGKKVLFYFTCLHRKIIQHNTWNQVYHGYYMKMRN